MAKSLEDPELWLPSEFLSEEDLLMDRESLKKNVLAPTHTIFPTEFPYEFDSFGFSSAISSPVESVAWSTETESSDEDDFLARLTRRLAQSSLYDAQKKSWAMAGSPESTLSGLGGWSASSNGSPNGPSQVPSPPTTPFGGKNDTWDLIYAAAGEVARLKMMQQGRCGHLNGGFYPQDAGIPCTNQYQQARQEQMLKQECSSAWERQVQGGWPIQPRIQNRGRADFYETGRCGHPVNQRQNSWASVQLQNQHQQPRPSPGSGMRAVFLGGSEVKKKCNGTGVFLPRRNLNPPEPRKKAGCSTVLLPAKVVQALNLNFDSVNGQAQPRFGAAACPQNHDGVIEKRNGLLTQQRRIVRPNGPLNHDPRLPQGWMY